MAGKKVVILDGRGPGDGDLASALGVLTDVLKAGDSQIETFPLRDMKLAHCLGCFGCWIKTPGMCVENDDGRRIARAVVQSDVTVFYTPVTFGGYAPELKRMMDRLISLISPYFQIEHGEIHHPPRYPRRPRLVVVGVQRRPNAHEAHIFKILAGRNAINFHPPSHAAEVVLSGDSTESLERRFAGLLEREDSLPFGEVAGAIMPPVVDEAVNDSEIPMGALLIVGSPKTSEPSTSNILGSYLLKRLSGYGWDTESLTLRASLNREEGQTALLEAVDRSSLIILAFPLYADALPYLVTKALTVIAAHRQAAPGPSGQRMMAIVNSGFPETHQNAVALAICEEFAAQSGIQWRGGLALPAGGMIGPHPLTMVKRAGPSVRHVVQGLDLTAAALAENRPVPSGAVQLFAKSPFPLLPFAAWRWIYMKFGGKGFEQQAARNGVGKASLLDRPYAA